jgi:hypothetical protein
MCGTSPDCHTLDCADCYCDVFAYPHPIIIPDPDAYPFAYGEPDPAA